MKLSIIYTSILISIWALTPISSYAQPTSSALNSKGFFDNLFPRRKLDRSVLGVNAFANDSRFGSVKSQFKEIKQSLGIKYIRILMNWDDSVQATPGSKPNFAFYDQLVNNLPSGTVAVAVLAGVPTWMHDSSNWINGDPRTTFAQRWVARVSRRYRKKSRLQALQIWNEPNDNGNPLNQLMGLNSSPENYVQLLSSARTASRKYSKKLLVAAATSAINQNYPKSLNYNKQLKAAGLETVADIWTVHYYGTHYENLLIPGGVGEFLNSISKPIWVTESGKQGVLEQLSYAERTWPLLLQQVPSIRRIYAYQFTDSLDADESWGLRTLDPLFPISDLYLWLKDNL